MHRILVLLFFTLFVTISCKQQQAHLFIHQNYDFVVPESKSLHKMVDKRLQRDFYSVKVWNFENFKSFQNDLKNVINQNKGGLLVLDDFLAPVLIKGGGYETAAPYGCLTYNQPEEIQRSETPFPVFNVAVKHQMLSGRIAGLMRHYSKSKDATDCLVVVNSDHELCTDLLDDLSNDLLNPRVQYYEGGGVQDIRLAIEDSSYDTRCVVFFAYAGNKLMLDLDKEDYPPFIEVMSNVGTVQKNVKYRISIDWEKALKYSISSRAFGRFAKSIHKSEGELEIEHHYVWQPDVITVNYYFSNFEVPFIKPIGNLFKSTRSKIDSIFKKDKKEKNEKKG